MLKCSACRCRPPISRSRSGFSGAGPFSPWLDRGKFRKDDLSFGLWQFFETPRYQQRKASKNLQLPSKYLANSAKACGPLEARGNGPSVGARVATSVRAPLPVSSAGKGEARGLGFARPSCQGRRSRRKRGGGLANARAPRPASPREDGKGAPPLKSCVTPKLGGVSTPKPS